MSDQLEKLLAQKPMKKPATGWKNWWRTLSHWQSSTTGDHFEPGDLEECDKVWPSKDIAESQAHKEMMDDVVLLGIVIAEYLGAYPEGERP